MGKSLVIVESPAKAKTINKILGKDFIVKASMGHVRDLPVKALGVDLEDNFKPKYVTVKGRANVVKELTTAAEKCDAVYLAPDPDREGEAIAWHLAHLLGKKIPEDKIFRVAYNEITPRAIRKAFDEPEELDMRRVDAQQARRILDRIVGYTVSPLLWRKIKSGLSAGRVQSVALRLVCERELEIRKFVPEKYWVMGANVRKRVEPQTPFEVRLARIDDEKAEIKSGEAAEGILKDLESRELRVKSIKTREISKKAPAPYITSTLQQAGSRFHGFAPQRTMRIAQSLYEGIDLGDGAEGLITYMRTDSVNIARDAVEASRSFIHETYGDEYVPEKPNVFKSRASAQEAHEAIRPTDVALTPDALKGRLGADELKLYKIIWDRFVACQMSPAKIEQRSIEIDAAAREGSDATRQYLFRASASHVVFPGYMKVSGVEKQKSEDGSEDPEALPPLAEGEALDCLEWLSEEKETQPPGRYSEASLVRALEENGVGRPSTYAQTLATLVTREYVEREKRTLFPTELGMKVHELLVDCLENLFNVSFTASMEEALDEVEKGSVEWTHMLQEFYKQFSVWIEEAKGPPIEPEKIVKLVRALDSVKEWAPEVKRGKRTYGDERFVRSLEKQHADAKRPFSDRQLSALAMLAWRYREQASTVESVLEEIGMADISTSPDAEPPRDTSLRKLELLSGMTLATPPEDDPKAFNETDFVASLKARTDGGRRLTQAQARVLNRLVLKYANKIPNFAEIKEGLDLDVKDLVDGDTLRDLIEAMGHVTEWREPVIRGKREFNDKSFYESLAGQLDQKGALSSRQYAALKRLVSKYKAQVPGYDNLAAKHEIGKKKAPKSDE